MDDISIDLPVTITVVTWHSIYDEHTANNVDDFIGYCLAEYGFSFADPDSPLDQHIGVLVHVADKFMIMLLKHG